MLKGLAWLVVLASDDDGTVESAVRSAVKKKRRAESLMLMEGLIFLEEVV